MTAKRQHRHPNENAEPESPNASEAPNEEASSSNERAAAEPGSEAPAASESPAQRPPMQRAEDVTDRLGERVGHFASLLGSTLWRLAARVGEEARSIWAEAQDVRRGGPPPKG
jgi:hypothetical protein